MFIYYIKNKKDGKGYIGQTNNMEIRMRTHFNSGTLYADKIFQREGRDNFDIRILFSSEDRSIINEKEKFFIKTLNTLYPYGYNISEGGQNNFLGQGNPHAKITRDEAQ